VVVALKTLRRLFPVAAGAGKRGVGGDGCMGGMEQERDKPIKGGQFWVMM
jgi:hypothetical protein